MKFDLYRDEQGWIAYMHCDCGTTLSGGHTSAANGTTFVAERALREHIAKGGSKCGTRNHSNVDCTCHACVDHNRKLGALVNRRLSAEAG